MPADLNDYFNKKIEILTITETTTVKISISKHQNLILKVLENSSIYLWGDYYYLIFNRCKTFYGDKFWGNGD